MPQDLLEIRNAEVRNFADFYRYQSRWINDEEVVILCRKKGIHAGKRAVDEWYFYADEFEKRKSWVKELQSEYPEIKDMNSDTELYFFAPSKVAEKLLASHKWLRARKRPKGNPENLPKRPEKYAGREKS